MHFSPELIGDYFQGIRHANTESAKKEHFIRFITQLFQDDPDAQHIIGQMTLGAEKTIFNIPLRHRLKTGKADTQYNRVIIEWEKDLRRTGAHAEDQLKEYLAGNLGAGSEDDFTLISTDGAEWRIYNRITRTLLLGNLRVAAEDIELKKTDSFVLAEENFAEFPLFLDRYLFKSQPERPTLASIVIDFGADSGLFSRAMKTMKAYLPDISQKSDVQTAYNEWRRFLSLAYGNFRDSDDIFFIHTYLSAFAKLLAFTVISPQKLPDTNALQTVLNGKAFHEHNILRFVEDDFFHWIATDTHFSALKSMFRDITEKLADYDFSDVREDILKGVYQELIDIETRHALGEYYTPDWLCELVLEDLPIREDSKILDPACGSGSFLRAAVQRLRNQFPHLSADQLTAQVQGIDVHPLSVQIAKTTLLVSLGKSIRKAGKPVALNVFLANTLLLPEGTTELFGQNYHVMVDSRKYKLMKDVFEKHSLFDSAVRFSDDLALRTQGQAELRHEIFSKSFVGKLGNEARLHADDFYGIYKALKTAKEEGRDSIWAFILLNLYKPFFLKGQFDIVVGNPPWLTYSDVSNAEYQNELSTLASRYGLATSTANMPHLELAAIFLAHSTGYFMKPGAQLAFVMPRSFLSADQHESTRSGKAKGFRLSQVWDLSNVSPLFNVPAAVLFAESLPEHLNADDKSHERAIPETGIAGKVISGKFETPNCHLAEVESALQLRETRWHYARLSTAKHSPSALTQEKITASGKQSFYATHFKNGATIYPRPFFFIDVAQHIEGDLTDYELLFVKSSKFQEAKAPWKQLSLEGHVQTKFLFRTALARNIVPFGLINPLLVLLPIEIESVEVGETKTRRIALRNERELLESGLLETSNWFKQAEEDWEKHKTERNKTISIYDYLNWQKKLTDQNLNTRHLILYTASAKDASAVVIDRTHFDFEFIIDCKTFWFATDNPDEAAYLASYLNSGYANQAIKAFQSRGLFGERHIHKKILELPLPKYDAGNNAHQELAAQGNACAAEVHEVILKNYLNADLSPNALGRVRKTIRQNLQLRFQEIDGLVEKILKG
ncbi:BseRI endonuclease, putative [Chloroherpeton thalassium ATCC 35110]|uniref:site-specific DNA-methyltransferase (adenine-specific) n=1 Tax=Chloroherpeton thalassium (strain ATCC 35110 / GB-78) TaxID=517418 RepID=B3QY04_CHLT3|nr:N-6 DNA methylase [Chloroherpeton thalassium]ACF13532.1 BseRI endonuclease, putative [Chloroherpeton thalassium ATCC 35110]